MSNDTNAEGTVEQWLQVRKEAALRIDAETAEVFWTYGLTMDPYGVLPDLPEEYRQIGREYFARSPESDIWVSFSDLPNDTCNKLWEMHKHNLALNLGALIKGIQKGNYLTAEKQDSRPATPKVQTN